MFRTYWKICFLVLNRRSFFVLIFLTIIFVLFNSQNTNITISATTEFDEARKLISSIRSNHPSVRGLKYRSMICTIVRNDPHILEFIVRHLIIGFSHIVLYDDNRIQAGRDMNISELLKPFIAADVVTHVPWNQNTVDSLSNEKKNGNSDECIEKYGKHSDWIAVLDTDEYFYYERKKESVNKIHELLLELEKSNVCGATIPWFMMYGEAKVLKQNKTLFEAYPRICGVHQLRKTLARTDSVQYNIPHEVFCKNPDQHVRLLSSTDDSIFYLIHYYSKSIEEFLVKADQSVPPYFREVIKSYDLGPSCQLQTVNYSKDYQDTFYRVHERLHAMQSLKLKYLQPISSLNIRTLNDYTMYIYMKYRCAKRHEFDNEKYLELNSEAKLAVQAGLLVDGLYHFMENFGKGIKGCWKTNEYSFCE